MMDLKQGFACSSSTIISPSRMQSEGKLISFISGYWKVQSFGGEYYHSGSVVRLCGRQICADEGILWVLHLIYEATWASETGFTRDPLHASTIPLRK
jgi:hypothetical protein